MSIALSGSILTGKFELSHAVMKSAAFLQSRDAFTASTRFTRTG
jgi:hypothetical protein